MRYKFSSILTNHFGCSREQLNVTHIFLLFCTCTTKSCHFNASKGGRLTKSAKCTVDHLTQAVPCEQKPVTKSPPVHQTVTLSVKMARHGVGFGRTEHNLQAHLQLLSELDRVDLRPLNERSRRVDMSRHIRPDPGHQEDEGNAFQNCTEGAPISAERVRLERRPRCCA